MRDIRFRAWDGERFTYWGFGVMKDAFTGPASTGLGNPMSMQQSQFTGLKDKNGREIYEGDIVAHECDGTSPTVITWDTEEWAEDGFYTGFMLFGTSDQYTVIGNIHENKELIK